MPARLREGNAQQIVGVDLVRKRLDLPGQRGDRVLEAPLKE
jgi:excinuclease UvrABC helicase subunit UvrB